jgi:hypothetical protein
MISNKDHFGQQSGPIWPIERDKLALAIPEITTKNTTEKKDMYVFLAMNFSSSIREARNIKPKIISILFKICINFSNRVRICCF